MDEDCDGRVDEHTCARGEVCSAGECTCPTRCGADCVDVDRDPNHCGGCGIACEPGSGCIDGSCCTLRGEQVDVLIVVKNDDGTALRLDERLRADLPALLRPLTSGDHDGDGRVDHPPAADLNVGVVSMDMRISSDADVPRCSHDRVHDGILRRRSETGRRDFCPDENPPVLEWRGEGSVDDFAWRVGCAGSLGILGCDLLQPLEAGLKALTPSTSPIRFVDGSRGHADAANAGFLRPNSFLLLVIVSTEDDCSARAPELYDLFVDGSPIQQLCIREPEWHHEIRRYVDGFAALRPPGRFHFAVLGGVPPDRATDTDDYADILTDPRMIPEDYPDSHDGELRIRPLCEIAPLGERWYATPTPRLVRVADGLAAGGYSTSVASLCTEDLVDAVETIALQVGERLNARCE